MVFENASITQADFPNTVLHDPTKSPQEVLFQFVALRRIFYAVSPSESTYERIETIPNYFDEAFGWVAIISTLEYIFHRLKGNRHGFALEDAITNYAGGHLQLVLRILERIVSIELYTYVWQHYKLLDLPWHSSVTWMVAFLLEDLAHYLAHRACHDVGILWAFHQMHHSSEYYNTTIAIRQGAFQVFAFAPFHLLPAVCIPPQVWTVHRYMNLLFQIWIHSEVRISLLETFRVVPKLGPLEWVLNTPSHHRVHHGRNAYCIDKNYGGTLIIWDRLFGTFAAEKPDEEIAYGLVEPVKSFDQLYLQLFEFKWFAWDKPWSMKHWCDAIKAPFMPAGWMPGMKTRQFFFWRYAQDSSEGIPAIEYPVHRLECKAPDWAKFYAVMQFLTLMFLYLFWGRSNKENLLSSTQFWVLMLYQIVVSECISWVFDEKPYVFKIEIVRLLFDITYISYLTVNAPTMILTRLIINTACLFGAIFIVKQQLWQPKKTKAQ